MHGSTGAQGDAGGFSIARTASTLSLPIACHPTDTYPIIHLEKMAPIGIRPHDLWQRLQIAQPAWSPPAQHHQSEKDHADLISASQSTRQSGLLITAPKLSKKAPPLVSKRRGGLLATSYF